MVHRTTKQIECKHFFGKWTIQPVLGSKNKRFYWQRLCLACAYMEMLTRYPND